jgi:hypothetical protein
MIAAHAKTWKTFLSVYSGGAASAGGEPSPRNPRRLDSDLLPSPFPWPLCEKYRVRGGETLGPAISAPSPPRPDRELFKTYGYIIRSRGSRNTLPLMVTEGTLAIARETRSVFREDKCYSNKSTYHFGFFARGIASQLFLRSIFRLITISLRLSREDTFFTGDFAPSNSA